MFYINTLVKELALKKTSQNTNLSTAAKFIARRIHELSCRHSQLEIATAAGFKSPGMLAMIKTGKAKLPLERVISLAKALECDPGHLVRLTLQQTLSQQVLDQIFAGAHGSISTNEWGIVVRVRGLSGNTDPKLTPAHDALLTKAFASPSPSPMTPPPASSDPIYANAVSMALLIQATLARRELRNAKKFTAAVTGRIDSVAARLETLCTELDKLIRPLPPKTTSAP